MTHQQHDRNTGQLQSEYKNTLPPVQHSFVMLTPHHPSLLQCQIQSPEPLRQVLAQLICSEHMELIGHYYDRQIDGQLFHHDILPQQYNGISWRIDMPKPPPAGRWLCTVILTGNNDDGLVCRHLLSFDMADGHETHGLNHWTRKHQRSHARRSLAAARSDRFLST